MSRYCKRFYCTERGERYCCVTCFLRQFCDNPCLNHPTRCGLEDTAHKQMPNRRGRPKKTD